jgi:superfamily II DNA or RNA helicase
VGRSIHLRPWQRVALDRLAASDAHDFLAVATPGAGKTTFALAASRQWLGEAPSPLVVVVPTAHLKYQWARAASALDLHLDAGWSPARGALPSDMHGVVTTYQQVATAPAAIASVATGAVVILDEIHHAGDERAWGDALVSAFTGARRRLALSGTPFRSDTRSIPFIRYVDAEASPDFEYGYGPALAEHRVVRPVYFPRTNGYMEWSAPDGTLHAATFDEALDAARANQRLRAALSIDGEWLPEVLRAAHARLLQIRGHHPDAGGLVIATDQDHARGIASIIESRLRARAVVATSDDPDASAKILRFSTSSDPWLVAVRMVSEGVDIPRLRVGVYATTTTTELFFRQAVGRLVRWQAGVGRQAAYLFIPDDRRLRTMAAEIADDRRHQLRRRDGAGDVEPFEPLEIRAADDSEQLSLFSVISSVATDAVIPADDVDDEPLEEVEDPLLELELPAPPPLQSGGGQGGHVHSRTEVKEDLRAKNAAIVRALAAQTGWTHAQVNGELNRRAGLRRVTDATVRQLETRLRHGERWFATKR